MKLLRSPTTFPGRTAVPEPAIGFAKVPPRGGGVSSRKLASDFFSDERLHIAEDGHWRPARGPTRPGARPTLVARVWAPSGGFFRQYFLLIPKTASVKFQDFWSCAE